MRYRIKHFMGKTPPVPNATQVPQEECCGYYSSEWEVEVEDIHKFAKQQGSKIMLSPPEATPFKGHWAILVDQDGKFKQR